MLLLINAGKIATARPCSIQIHRMLLLILMLIDLLVLLFIQIHRMLLLIVSLKDWKNNIYDNSNTSYVAINHKFIKNLLR